MAQRASVAVPDNFTPLEYIERSLRNSDCRTPIIFVQEDGDPFASVTVLAEKRDLAVWSFDVSLLQSAQNIVDYVEVGVNNGDWVYITNCDIVGEEFFRDVARILFSLQPDPLRYPRRELFRCFFGVRKPFDPNAPVGVPFPTLFMHDAIIARKVGEEGSKWSRIVPVDDPLFTEAAIKHEHRRAAGRDSDSESDLGSNEHISGMIFHRCAERTQNIDQSPVTLSKNVLEKAISEQDCNTIKRLINSGEVDVSRKVKEDMTPIQFAVCKQLTESVRTLLEMGADPNAPRESDGRPPLFMSLDDINLAAVLVEGGGNLFAKYQGYRPDNHPDTAPNVAAYFAKQRLRV